MSAAIELFGEVFTTAGGTRYHADPECTALVNGRTVQAYRAGETWLPGAGSMPGLYPLKRSSTLSAAHVSLTACLVCVPRADALPPLPFVGNDFGHRPEWINAGYCGGCTNCGDTEEQEICVRCSLDAARRADWARNVHVIWPCTSALVLGLVEREES